MMYVLKNFVNLATHASPIYNNIALQYDSHDSEALAPTIAVIQDAFVNVVPIDDPNRRSKYIPASAEDRGAGNVTEVKWLEISKTAFLVILSTHGVQVYESDGSKCVFQHGCRDISDEKSYTKGLCVMKSNVLCVGTWVGTVWMFRYEKEINEFKYINRVYAHDEAVMILDGHDKYMASTSTDMSYFWSFKTRDFHIIRKLSVPGLISIPTTLRYAFDFIIMGYRSGEFCIFDSNDEDYVVRVPAHKLQITSLDIAANLIIVTVSDDCYIKLWKFTQENADVLLIQTIFNEDGPLYGVGFLNYKANEFAVVTGGSAKVNIYMNWQQGAGEMPTSTLPQTLNE